MFKLEEFMGRRVLKSSLLEDEQITAFFTTRDLPLKFGEREDLKEEVENNKKLVCEGLNITYKNLVIPQQTHSDNVGVVKKANYDSSPSHPLTSSTIENTDALVTNERNIALALNFADCVPIIFYDPIKRVIASAHAGWRGTASKIAAKTVQKMINEFGCEPENIIAAIGPSIGKCCFEVQDDVNEKLLKSIDESFRKKVFENNHLDLKQINKFQLLAMGLNKIDVCEYCTSCKNELFFSYRKENGNTARHSTVIMMGAN